MARPVLKIDELKDMLILLSYDTITEEKEIYHNAMPYSFTDGCLLRYELDGEDDIDQTINLEEYQVAATTPYDVDGFEDVAKLLVKILMDEGKEIVREAPMNDEEVVDGRVTLTLYDSSREEVLSRTRTFKKSPVKAMPESAAPSKEDFMKSLEATIAARRASCIHDWIRLGYNLLKAAVIGALVLWWFSKSGFPEITIWLTSVFSGIYFTYLWWCNTYQIPLFIDGFRSRRAEDRPWINGGFLVGLGIGIILLFVPDVDIIHAYMTCLVVAPCVTFSWWLYRFIDDLLDDSAMRKALRIVQRMNRRQNRRNFFSRMFDF